LPFFLAIDLLGPTTSPIIGNAAITPTEVGYFQNGLVYLQIADVANNVNIRGQVINYPARMNGTAPFGLVFDMTPTSGGGLIAGSTTVQERINPVISGGAYLAGDTNNYSYIDQDIKGGVHIAGSRP
jgi:hypothetical protein